MSELTIRDPSAADEVGWRKLWAAYNLFYETCVPEVVTSRTWARMLDPTSPLIGRIATRRDQVIGFTVSVIHEGSWTVTPVCYLEDLFVDEKYRGQGVGRLLLQDILGRARSEGWSRLYWHTRADNPARRLYDEFGRADGFVRYRLSLR